MVVKCFDDTEPTTVKVKNVFTLQYLVCIFNLDWLALLNIIPILKTNVLF